MAQEMRFTYDIAVGYIYDAVGVAEEGTVVFDIFEINLAPRQFDPAVSNAEINVGSGWKSLTLKSGSTYELRYEETRPYFGGLFGTPLISPVRIPVKVRGTGLPETLLFTASVDEPSSRCTKIINGKEYPFGYTIKSSNAQNFTGLSITSTAFAKSGGSLNRFNQGSPAQYRIDTGPFRNGNPGGSLLISYDDLANVGSPSELSRIEVSELNCNAKGPFRNIYLKDPISEFTISTKRAVNVSTNGGSDGLIEVQTSGGSGNFDVKWYAGKLDSNGNPQGAVIGTALLIQNLTAGEYRIFVTDNVTGAVKSLGIVLTQPGVPPPPSGGSGPTNDCWFEPYAIKTNPTTDTSTDGEIRIGIRSRGNCDPNINDTCTTHQSTNGYQYQFFKLVGTTQVQVSRNPFPNFNVTSNRDQGTYIVKVFRCNDLSNVEEITVELVAEAVPEPEPAAPNDYHYVPILNSFRFFQPYLQTDLDALEFNKETYKGLYKKCYYQPVLTSDIRDFQWQSNYEIQEVKVLDRNGSIIGGSETGEITIDLEYEGINTEGVGFNHYQAQINFNDPYLQGQQFIQIAINGNDGLPATSNFVEATSELIIISNEFEANTELIGFFNKHNDENLWFANSFIPKIRVFAHKWKRLPTSSRTYFRTSEGLAKNLASRTIRQIEIKFYQVPPYKHEQLSIGMSLDTIIVGNEGFVSESGLNDPEYLDLHYQLSNSTALLEAKVGFNYPDVEVVSPDTFIVKNGTRVDQLLVDENGNFIVYFG